MQQNLADPAPFWRTRNHGTGRDSSDLRGISYGACVLKIGGGGGKPRAEMREILDLEFPDHFRMGTKEMRAHQTLRGGTTIKCVVFYVYLPKMRVLWVSSHPGSLMKGVRPCRGVGDAAAHGGA